MDEYDSDDDFNDQYNDDYDYDSDECIDHVFFGELASIFCDYHPYRKKSKKTFLDLYFVAERTKQLLDSS